MGGREKKDMSENNSRGEDERNWWGENSGTDDLKGQNYTAPHS